MGSGARLCESPGGTISVQALCDQRTGRCYRCSWPVLEDLGVSENWGIPSNYGYFNGENDDRPLHFGVI